MHTHQYKPLQTHTFTLPWQHTPLKPLHTQYDGNTHTRARTHTLNTLNNTACLELQRGADAAQGAGVHDGDAVAQQVGLVHEVRGQHGAPGRPRRPEQLPRAAARIAEWWWWSWSWWWWLLRCGGGGRGGRGGWADERALGPPPPPPRGTRTAGTLLPSQHMHTQTLTTHTSTRTHRHTHKHSHQTRRDSTHTDASHARVHSRGGLVQKDHCRPAQQRDGDRQLALLPAAHLRCNGVALGAQTHCHQHFVHGSASVRRPRLWQGVGRGTQAASVAVLSSE
jgi:hypothetical protein